MFTSSVTDRSHDIFKHQSPPLQALFSPQTVALVGATDKEGSVGRTLLWNLLSNPFGGTIYPVNPKRNSVLGIPSFHSLSDIPAPIDLILIAVPAPQVPAIIAEGVKIGAKSAIIISAGFKEIGSAGIQLEQEIMSYAKGKLRIIGPNCLGLMNPISGLNATFAQSMAQKGNVGFISQSGAFCTAVLDWSFREKVGFSAFISIGSMLDVDWGDLIYYLGDDPNTKSIVIYMESIGNARSFLSAAREVSFTKPIIIIKAGQTEQAAKAAASHTGALTGSDEVLEAAFRRCGVLRVKTIEELFNMAEVLAKQPNLPKNPYLAIITNAGGPGVIATDALIATGGELAELSPETISRLNEVLPAHWSHNNPIDILGDAGFDRYEKTLDIALQDPNSDGLLVILTPQAMTNPAMTAEKLVACSQKAKKPILASWMGGDNIDQGEAILNEAQIPTYRYPDTAARVFNRLWKYSYNLQGIYETPIMPFDEDSEGKISKTKAILQSVRSKNRTLLTESESKEILAIYDIPTVPTGVARSLEEAVALAEQFGYPVVLKIYSETLTHKTDVGGVQLNLNHPKAVKWAYETIEKNVLEKAGEGHFLGVTVQPMLNLNDAYELIIGSSIDPQFGPVLLFGSGGQLVEIYKDRSLALPPLNTTLARRMMEQTKIYKALHGIRGRKPVDLNALEQLLVRFSQLVVEQPWIKEIDINPLLANDEGLTALDARIVLHSPDIDDTALPKPAVRPYPIQYVADWTLKNGIEVTLRPIRPEDEPLLKQLHENISEESVYFRYFHLMKLTQRITHERLSRLCFIDYDREIALIAESYDPETDRSAMIGIGRLSKLHGVNMAEFSMIVMDQYQNQGLGTELLTRLVQIAKNEQIEAISAEILTENRAMQRVCKKVGFSFHHQEADIVQALLTLSDRESSD